MRNFKEIAVLGVLSATLLLSACSSPTPEPAIDPPIETSTTTLNGGVVSGPGISIKEVDPADINVEPSLESALTRVSFDSVLIESGGSSGKDCQSNFIKIDRAENQVNLTHTTGDGEMRACTMDYQQKFFLIEAAENFADDTLFNILDTEGEVIITYDITGALISE